MACQGFIVGDAVVLDGIGKFGGVFIVDAVHLGGLDDGIALQFHAAQSSCGVGGKVGVARTGGANDHSAFFHVAQGAAANKGLAHFLHGNGRKHARGVAQLFQHVLHCKGVEHGGQHAHVVGR